MSATEHLSPHQFTAFHSGDHPNEYPGERWLHAGTIDAAADRGEMYPERGLHKVALAPQHPVNTPDTPVDDYDANRIDNWISQGRHTDNRGRPAVHPDWVSNSSDQSDLKGALRRTGFDPSKHDAMYYTNGVEDRGTVSVMASPRRTSVVRSLHYGQGRLF